MTREEAIKYIEQHAYIDDEVKDMCIEALGKDINVTSKWIPCEVDMPKERDSIFKKFKGTDKWSGGMFETISNIVQVTYEFETGERIVGISNTLDGKWKKEPTYKGKRIIAWKPLDEPYKGE